MSQNASTFLEEQTPLMRQYWELKAKAGDALLFFRMGDFYELFGDDAVTASQLLDITLTSRDKNKPNPLPMAGVPYHSVQGYIQKVLKAGKKLAICEQFDDSSDTSTGSTNSKSGTKIVRREIVRILTPAVQFDAEGSDANYLAIAVRSQNQNWVLSCLDVSTGEVLVSDSIPLKSIADEFQRLPIRHFLRFDPELDTNQFLLSDTALLEELPKNYISQDRAETILKFHYGLENLHAFITTEAGILGLGILVTYALRTQKQEKLEHLRLPEPLQKPQSLILGPNTAQHLDLSDLFQLINKTRSTLGARQLKRWLMAPLCTTSDIEGRQKAVIELAAQSSSGKDKLSSELSQIYDLERICGRVNTKLASPKDTLALGQSLLSLRSIQKCISGFNARLLSDLGYKCNELIEKLFPLAEKITTQQKENAPLVSRDGGIFKTGTTPDLDRLISLTEDGQRWLVELETRERESTGIPSLKVRYNRVFGYYIEITQSHLKNVPNHYQRKQTMVGAERFFTDELKKFEEEILTASVRQKSLEQELFNSLIAEIQEVTPSIMEAARLLGEVDALCSLSHLASQSNWNFPKLDDSFDLEITAGRHPLVDQAKRGRFVPNDLNLSPETRLTLLVTGPNMGGKSTVMRQTALILILGQMGAPVPATSAKWGVVSSVYTRIGAQDAIARGQSTFMVEMSELAHILHHANERSFIVLDEIGRGTSTYDGISVAWATLEWICTKIRARTLFATHYHELIPLAATLPQLANSHMAVENTDDARAESLRFLYELREGPTNDSFGIHVAQLAGLPKEVIDRSWKVLENLESNVRTEGKVAINAEANAKSGPQARVETRTYAASENADAETSDAADVLETSSDSDTNKAKIKNNQLSFFDHPKTNSTALVKCGEKTVLNPALEKLGKFGKELEKIDINDLTPLQALNTIAKWKTRLQQ